MRKILTILAVLALAITPLYAQSKGYVKILKDSSGASLTGAQKTATFNSETLNLQGFATFCIIVDVGTVAAGTLDIKVQMSLDGGTTYLDTFGAALNSGTQAALAQITAAGESNECWRNPLPVIAGFATGGTAVTPRVRFVFTMATSPDMTFTNVYVAASESP